MSQLRINGIFDVDEVAWAIVETNGKLTVYPKFRARPLTPEIVVSPENQKCDTPPMVLISDGEVKDSVLKICNLTEKWFENVLRKENLTPKDIFLMTCNPTAEYHIVKKDGVK